MNFWPLILLLGTCFPHSITSAKGLIVTWDLSNGVLKDVSSADATDIELSNLGIKSLAESCFDALIKIVSLDLSNNELTYLPPMIFSKLENLKRLTLSKNHISAFNNAFVGLTNLEFLDISENPISSLRKGDFFGLPKSVNITIDRTDLRQISSRIFEDPSVPVTTKNEEIVLNEGSESHLYVDNRTRKMCITPDGILESIEEAEPGDDVGKCILQSESEIRWSRSPAIDLSRSNITGFKHKWYSVKDPFYHTIDLDHNNIDDLSPELINDLPPTVKTISLYSNKITAIKNNGIENNNSISINLRDNEISTIEDGALEKLNLNTLKLERNILDSTAFARTLPMTITTLGLDNNRIVEVPHNSFHGLKNLQSLSINNNKVQNIESGTFRDQENLLYLGLNWNKISVLESGFLRGLDRLENIDLSGNKIQKIPSNLFEGGNHLSMKLSVLLDQNQIKTIEDNAFEKLNLDHLRLEDNHLNSTSFARTMPKTIRSLELNYNLIVEVPLDSFYGLKKLESLMMRGNQVKDIAPGTFRDQENLSVLDLGDNKIAVLKPGSFQGLAKLKRLDLSSNQIAEVSIDSFYGLKNLESLLMNWNKIENIEPGTFRDQVNLSLLDLSINEIGVLKPGIFQGLDKLEIINLSFNQIRNIPSHLFEGWNHPSTKFSLLLEGNHIKTIESGAFSHRNLRKLDLKNNKFGDDSIQEGSFDGSIVSELSLGSDELTRFNGEWFRGISELEIINLGSCSVRKLEKGFAKYMKNVTTLQLRLPFLLSLQNGALFGLSKNEEVTVYVSSWEDDEVKFIEGGLFEDV